MNDKLVLFGFFNGVGLAQETIGALSGICFCIAAVLYISILKEEADGGN